LLQVTRERASLQRDAEAKRRCIDNAADVHARVTELEEHLGPLLQRLHRMQKENEEHCRRSYPILQDPRLLLSLQPFPNLELPQAWYTEWLQVSAQATARRPHVQATLGDCSKRLQEATALQQSTKGAADVGAAELQLLRCAQRLTQLESSLNQALKSPSELLQEMLQQLIQQQHSHLLQPAQPPLLPHTQPPPPHALHLLQPAQPQQALAQGPASSAFPGGQPGPEQRGRKPSRGRVRGRGRGHGWSTQVNGTYEDMEMQEEALDQFSQPPWGPVSA
jgi:hypothetical protein